MYTSKSGEISLKIGNNMICYRSKESNLSNAGINVEQTIRQINTCDEELKNFLFTLGCYSGEKVTVLSVLGENYVISVKDARYSIDKDIAQAIIV